MTETLIQKTICIFCNNLSSPDFTKEHIIPQVLGGWLTIPFVCNTCNNKMFGAAFEADLKKNPFIISAIEKLRFQSKKEAFRSVHINLETNLGHKLKGYFNDKGELRHFTQRINDDFCVQEKDELKTALKKKLEREKIAFDKNLLDDFSDYILNEFATPITSSKMVVNGVTYPISYRLPAKIAFEYLAKLSYPFVMKKEFDSIRKWILNEGNQTYVIPYENYYGLQLSNIQPEEHDYKAFHLIRYSYQDKGLAAYVCLFGLIDFVVFLGKLENINDFPSAYSLNCLHVFDIKKKEVYQVNDHTYKSIRKEDGKKVFNAIISIGMSQMERHTV